MRTLRLGDAALTRDRHPLGAWCGAIRRHGAGVVSGVKIAAGGVGLGVIGALLIARALRTLLFNVSTTDPLVFTGIVIVLSVTACLASYLPARRAARLDPLATLRTE